METERVMAAADGEWRLITSYIRSCQPAARPLTISYFLPTKRSAVFLSRSTSWANSSIAFGSIFLARSINFSPDSLSPSMILSPALAG